MRAGRGAGGAIRASSSCPTAFPAAAAAEAEQSARRPLDQHADRTALPFVTLDPAESRDLDQAFAIEPAGQRHAAPLCHRRCRLVRAGRRGDGRRGLAPRDVAISARRQGAAYPPVLSEGAASLLPDGDRPAIIFTVRLDPNGEAGWTAPSGRDPQPRQARL